MSDQKTIHEKWEEGGITILPPKKLTKKEIREKLRDPSLPDEERYKLMDLLWEGIDVKEKPTKWESYEDAKKRIDEAERKKQIKKKLKDPNLSAEEKDKLMDLLWEGIDVKD